MTCRYAHKRIALLVTAVQTPVANRVIAWPQKINGSIERGRVVAGKSQREGNYANK